MATTQVDLELLAKLQEPGGYKGYRISESEYSRQYENGPFVPQYQDSIGRWHSYFRHTANRASVKRGIRSYKSTSIAYKTPQGAMGYLIKHERDLQTEGK